MCVCLCVMVFMCQERLLISDRKQQPHLLMVILFMLSTPEQTSIHHSSIHRGKAGSVKSHKRQHNNVSQFIPLTWTYPQLDPYWMEIRYCSPDVAGLVCIIACYDAPFSFSLSVADEVSKSDDEDWTFADSYTVKCLLSAGENTISLNICTSCGQMCCACCTAFWEIVCHPECAQQVATCLTPTRSPVPTTTFGNRWRASFFLLSFVLGCIRQIHV